MLWKRWCIGGGRFGIASHDSCRNSLRMLIRASTGLFRTPVRGVMWRTTVDWQSKVQCSLRGEWSEGSRQLKAQVVRYTRYRGICRVNGQKGMGIDLSMVSLIEFDFLN